MVGDLGPGADPHPVGLRDPAVLEQRPRRRLLVGPDTLLEGAPKLGMVRLAHEVVALVVERRVEEEPLVLELEVLVLLADAALAKGESCSPSARARTVTAHSLKAIGMGLSVLGELVSVSEPCRLPAGAAQARLGLRSLEKQPS